MDTFLPTAVAAAGLFAAANTGDMIVFAVLNASSRPKRWHIWPASTPGPPPWSWCRWPPGTA
jgi:hypothetical protein